MFRKHNFFIVVIILSFFFSSCSTWTENSHSSYLSSKNQTAYRLPASEVDELIYYLSIDKFKYYLSEYSLAMEDALPAPVIDYLKKITVEDIIAMKLTPADLSTAKNFDKIIWNLLKAKNLHNSINQAQVQWGYNFFKNKQDEAFALKPSKLDLDLALEERLFNPGGYQVEKVNTLQEKDMTLDAGHYISNRTTRAIFWEANQSGRDVEFFLGDSREFLKGLREDGGEILYEVKPLAKNYNKLFIVKYPNEKNYRLAITNIGGHDRLQQLKDQLALSRVKDSPVKSTILIKGDLNKFHAARTQEHVAHLKLLPRADRVIIGQKESIDGKFELFWKLEALKRVRDFDNSLIAETLAKMPERDRAKFAKMVDSNPDFEFLFKEKRVLEVLYESVLAVLEKNPELNPVKFKTYNFDNFTIEMCDYEFTNSEGKPVRWRVASNVWGDEVIPLAQALKLTGHTKVTYMGTAGAFAGKGHKVGDLVSPSHIMDGDKKLAMIAKPMQIAGAFYKGTVEHVGSIFEETYDWLKKVMARSEFVEVETSYLRRIFNGPKDELEIFLLISDVLGSESETLAHATSSKRKNAQNKLLAAVFKRDTKGLPTPGIKSALSSFEKTKQLIFKTLANKSLAYRYYAHSHLKGKANLTVKEIEAFAAKQLSFTDDFLIKRLVRVGELIQEINERDNGKSEFQIAFSKSIVDGTYSAKTDKLAVVLLAKSPQDEARLKKSLEPIRDYLEKISALVDFTISTENKTPNLVLMKHPEKIDVDFFLKIYSYASFRNVGVYRNVTYNGNVTLAELPISNSEDPSKAFVESKVSTKFNSLKVIPDGTCKFAMASFLIIMGQ
jgi:hypothetical protein